LHEHQHPVGALAFLSPYARGPTAARIGLVNPSSGEVDSGMSTGRLALGPRRLNYSATIWPVVFSHSLRRGMPVAWQRSVNGAQNDGPVNAASVSPSSSSIASRCSG
jgi:hypothetical protein